MASFDKVDCIEIATALVQMPSDMKANVLDHFINSNKSSYTQNAQMASTNYESPLPGQQWYHHQKLLTCIKLWLYQVYVSLVTAWNCVMTWCMAVQDIRFTSPFFIRVRATLNKTLRPSLKNASHMRSTVYKVKYMDQVK